MCYIFERCIFNVSEKFLYPRKIQKSVICKIRLNFSRVIWRIAYTAKGRKKRIVYATMSATLWKHRNVNLVSYVHNFSRVLPEVTFTFMGEWENLSRVRLIKRRHQCCGINHVVHAQRSSAHTATSSSDDLYFLCCNTETEEDIENLSPASCHERNWITTWSFNTQLF